jgi:hypothetical protein
VVEVFGEVVGSGAVVVVELEVVAGVAPPEGLSARAPVHAETSKVVMAMDMSLCRMGIPETLAARRYLLLTDYHPNG